MKFHVLSIIFILNIFLFSCTQKKVKGNNTAANTTQKSTTKKEPLFELAWKTDTIFKTTESCLYDAKHDVIYVSNVNNAPRTKDNNGFISTLNTNGEVLKLDWATGMSAPKGMAYFNEVLYVTDIDAVVEIDPHTGKITKRNTLEGALMLNDITVDNLGTVYVSAMDTGKIYMLEDGDFTLWKENLNKPNGLLIEGNSLLVASLGDGTFKSFDITTRKEQKTIATNLGRADGIVQLKSGNYVVSDWLGEIHYIKDGKTTSLLNTIENKKLQTADIGYFPKGNLVLVPTFFGNGVEAYKIRE